MTPKPSSGMQAALPSMTKGLGYHFASPRNKKNPRKTQTFVSFPGQAHKRQRLLNCLDNLFNHKMTCEPPECEVSLDAPPESFTLETETIGNMDVEETDNKALSTLLLCNRLALTTFLAAGSCSSQP